MRQNRKKQTTSSETIREKHACPMTVAKQNQGTGNNRFDPKTQKSTGPEIHIVTGFSYAATPGLYSHLEHFDPVERTVFSAILNDAHYDIAQTILSILAAKGVAVSSLDGESLRVTIRFLKNIPEAP
ncbi:hypothetical protein Mlab_1606 [Methanocorpusculum labreanum Z]|uniref:Uncharacterized protein n=1 Tax=Methanocorpusculum labreanum (strain ATCC 43576 / DSM 4855 / Z) TaxID=410358 RepID=A2STW2_METLZ|nr:hypothetical protein [Methanocorpusculum labreanum]ABN07768.1 hypothetical protein Mlab_1606 [Methanocorpusculum labreanum Z]